MIVNIFCISMKTHVSWKTFCGCLFLYPVSFEKIGRRKLAALIKTDSIGRLPKL